MLIGPRALACARLNGILAYLRGERRRIRRGVVGTRVEIKEKRGVRVRRHTGHDASNRHLKYDGRVFDAKDDLLGGTRQEYHRVIAPVRVAMKCVDMVVVLHVFTQFVRTEAFLAIRPRTHEKMLRAPGTMHLALGFFEMTIARVAFELKPRRSQQGGKRGIHDGASWLSADRAAGVVQRNVTAHATSMSFGAADDAGALVMANDTRAEVAKGVRHIAEFLGAMRSPCRLKYVGSIKCFRVIHCNYGW